MDENIMTAVISEKPAIAADILYTQDSLTELSRVCERLHRLKRPLEAYPQDETKQYFALLMENTSIFYAIKITLKEATLDWEQTLSLLQSVLPQFAFVETSFQQVAPNVTDYYFTFMPLFWEDLAFPFGIQLLESITQQLPYEREDALERLDYRITYEILTRKLDQPLASETVPQGFFSEVMPANEPAAIPEKEQPQPGPDSSLEEKLKSAEVQLRDYQKANRRLELQLEKIEKTLINQAVQVGQQSQESKQNWHKRTKISLKEYAMLSQKARYLEKIWDINHSLIQRSEKMTITNQQITYELNQFQDYKKLFSAKDIFLVFDESQAIEARVKIKQRPWFRKPYVKIMTMDYESMLNKSAYFDLLQAESYFLEEVVFHEEAI